MSEENPVVSEGKVVVFHYTLTDDDGEQIESSRDKGQPLPYLHGSNSIVPGLEQAMDGKEAGDEFVADLDPEDAYGQRHEEGESQVGRSEFPDDVELFEGMAFTAEGPDGSEIPLWITEIDGDDITVDPNHPLAGETLHFDVEIIDVRDATDEEIQHGHAHGLDGQSGH